MLTEFKFLSSSGSSSRFSIIFLVLASSDSYIDCYSDVYFVGPIGSVIAIDAGQSETIPLKSSRSILLLLMFSS
jgi:hypothetical protein